MTIQYLQLMDLRKLERRILNPLSLQKDIYRGLKRIWVFDVSCGIHASKSWVMGAPIR